MVEAPLPAVIGEVAVTADCAADTVPAFTTTVAVWVIATALIVAETVLEPAAVDDRVPVATPLASVVPTGWVRVLPAVGAAASVTVAPGIGFPFASRAVTVIVDVPLPAAIGDVALTVDCTADTPPAFTTTVAVCVIATALIVADTVFDPAAVDEKLPVATPLASFAVTVIVDLPLPAVIGDVAVTVDCAAETVPGFTTTVAVCVTATPSIVADTVFDSATVELRVPVATPLAFVVALGCVTVLPRPVALRMTVAPAMGLPNASRAVTVTVD